MEKNLRNIIIIIVVALAAVGALLYFLPSDTPVAPSEGGQLSLADLALKSSCLLPAEGANLDEFAKCIADSGAKFYGAFWCSHCKDQKDLFGDSAQYLPYVECSTPDGNNQLPVCADEGIKIYPTWRFR